MSSINTLPTTIIDPAEPLTREAFRIPNPLRSGLLSFVATLVLIGAGAAVLNAAVDRGLDTYYDKQLAALAKPVNAPAYDAARAMATAQEMTTGVVTVSAN